MVGEKMSRIEEARKRIKEQEKQISTKVSKAMQQGVNMQKNKLKLNNVEKNKAQQSFTGDVSNINIKSNISNSSSIDNLYNNVINPMNQFNSSLFYNIGKLPAKAIYKTASAAKNVLRGEEHPFQKAQEKANETFSNFEKNVGYDTSNKDSKIQKANRAGQAVGNTLGYVLGSKALGGGALGYGATSGMNAYANTNDIGDIAFSTGKGAVFGKLNSVIGGGTKNVLERVPIMNTAISATNPSTLGSIFHFGANATKNVVAGGVGMYGAGAITGEAENIYNLIRERDVTKKDWLKPIWSDEALSNAIIGGIIGGVSGTAADLKKAQLQYKNDYKTLIENLNNKNNAMVKALQNGELQTAQNLNQEAIEMIQAFNNMQYMGFRLDENGKNTLLNMWQATAYANAETNYRPKMLGEETPKQSSDISQLQTNTQMPKNNFNNIQNTTNINEKASNIWQNFKNNAQNSTYNSDQTPKNQNSAQNNAQNMQNNLKNDDIGVFDTEREYNTSSLPKNEEEVKINVRNRLNKEIEKDIEIFVENNTDDYQGIKSSDIDYEIEDILKKMYTTEEIDYLYDTDLSSEVFNKISDIISNELEKHFYTYNSETEMYEPNTDKLGSSDEIRFKYDKLPSTDFEYKQLDNIRNMIDDLTWDMKKTLPDGIDITVDESRASADATYITVSNENTDETYEIRVGNYFKSGTSGNADEHIRISDFKTISKLKENIKEKIENGLIDVGSENIQSDTVNELKEEYDVDINKKKSYNIINKSISNREKAQVSSEVRQWYKNTTNGIGYIDLSKDGYKSYIYIKNGDEVTTLLKVSGSEEFKNYVRRGVENGTFASAEGLNKSIETIKSEYRRYSNDSNVLPRRRTSNTDDTVSSRFTRQQSTNNTTDNITKDNRDEQLKNSEQSSFSLSKDNQGRTLSREQQKYFKNSKVRDENGNLLEVYHGTQNGGFTEFHGYSYFTDNPDAARSYSGSIENITKYTFESRQRTTIGNYKGYLNLINPYIIDLKGAEWGEINIDSLNIPEIQQWIKEAGVSTWNDNGKTFISTDDIVSIVDAMNDSGKNYDGIILKNIRDNGMRANTNDNISTDYVAFKGKEQFKSIDNTKPTSNPDILKSKGLNAATLPEVEKLLYDKEFIYQKVESRLEDAFKFKIGNEDVKIYRKFRDQIKPIIKEKATRIEQLIKLNALTEDTLNSIINEIFEQEIGITKDEITLAELTREEIKALKERNATVKEYIESMHGKNEITEISNEIKETITKVNMRFEKAYSDIDENLVEEAKKGAIKLMRSSKKFSDNTINSFLKGYANDYEKGIYSQVLDAFLYYSRPLERIEANNYEGIKKTNYLIEKRKWDLQHNGKIEQSGYQKGVNWRNLRTTIEEHLGKEIRLKGFKQKAYGIYKPTLDEIRIKNISNIETILHELGHRFDFKEIERNVEDTKINEELKLLCQRAFKDAYNNNPGLMLEEGWAEFTRRFICDNEKTVKEYPATSEFFVNEMDNSKRLQKTVTELIDMVETYVHSNSNTAISAMISVGEDTTKKLTLQDRFDKFVENIFDDLWALKNVSKTMAKAKSTKYYKEDPTQNPYYNKRLNKESEEKIKDIVKHGFVDDNGIRVTKGLTEILKPFEKNTKKVTDIRNLLWARRAIDYLARDLPSGLGITDTINVITSITDEDVLNAVQEIEEFANYPFELAYKRGMLTKTQYEDIKKWNKFYVPVKRVFEDQINLARGKSGELIKARTGSERDIIDFMETITQNTAFMIDKISQNEGLQILARNADLKGVSDYYSIIDLPQKLTATVNLDIFKSALQEQLGEQTVDDLGINFGIVRKLFSPKLKDDATRTLTFMQDGKMRAIQFYNDSLYKIYSNANSASMLESLKLFDKATGILRAGATALNAEFALPNMVSDTFVAWVYSDNGFVPIVDTVRGIFDYVIAEYNIGKADTQNKLLYSYYRQSGASMSTRVATFRPEVQDFIKDVIGKHATKIYSDNPKTVKEVFKTILKEAGKLHNGVQDFLSIIPEASEQATRFSYFKKSYNKYIKKGWEHRRAMLQAGIETKDATVDFNRAGKVTRVTNRLKAFSNAVLQGFYRGLEGMSKNPVKAPAKILFVVATWAIIHKMFGEDKRLEEVPEQTKKDNYVFMIGDTIIKIKKPQDAIVKGLINAYELIGTILSGDEEAISKSFENYAEDIINDITSYNVDFDKTALNNIMSIALQTFTAIEPVAELVGNKDFYFDSQITPYGTEDNSPQYQYDEYTSETAKLLGEKLKESPAQIEHLITSYGAGVGKRLLEISDRLIDFVSDDVTLPDEALSDKFIVNRFVVDENKNSQSVSDVYEAYDKLNTKKKDEEFTGVGLNEEEQEQFKKLTQAKETFSKISKEKRKIQSTLSLSGKEKRQKLDELNSLRTDVARYYLGKELINSENRDTIELYEYYPASNEYTYTPKNSLKVDVKYEEEDKKEYAQLCRKKYKELTTKTKVSYKYQKASKEEKEKLIKSDLTKARNYAKDIVSKKVYERGK